MNGIASSIIACALLVSSKAYSGTGFAVVSDEDGHSNIRKSADLKGEVVGKVNDGSIVFVVEEKGDWLAVSYWEGDKDKYGFLHRSRARPVDRLKAVPVKSEEDRRLVFELGALRIEIESEEFDAKKLPITFVRFPDGGEFISKIDGKPIWGTDGGLPKTRYKRIAITHSGKETVIPPEAIGGFYEPNMTAPFTSAFLDKGTDTLFITAHNSDGAGFYAVAFRIVKGKYSDRMIFTGY